jgi:hypothetical protein
MARLRLATALVAILLLGACTDPDSLTSPTGVLPGGGASGIPSGGGGGGDTTSTPGDTTSTPGDTTSNPVDTTGAGDPVNNGTWTNPDSTTIDPVDPVVYQPVETGTAGTSGSSTTLIFKTSGSGLYGVGTCSANGFWTDPAGNVFGPHNPNCLDYGSDGSPGNNGKGTCITSASGQPGLWVNPGGQQTHPFHSKCARTGATTSSLALSFAPQAQIFDANDGSGNRVMNFYSTGVAVAQLRYDGAANTTVGAGILVGSDNASPANTWTVFFGQPALSYSSGLVNGDLIGDMTGAGVEVVACNTAIGCSLVTLQLTVTP